MATEDEGGEIDLDPRVKFEDVRRTSDEPMMTVQLDPHPHQVTRLGSGTHRLVRGEIERLLVANSDLFVWSPLTCLA